MWKAYKQLKNKNGRIEDKKTPETINTNIEEK